MSAKALASIAVFLAAITPICASAESLNVKPGAWELNVTTVTTGNPIPPDALADLPPDKRASVEESMKARDGKPVTRAFRICVTQADLDRNSMIQPKDDDGHCKRNILSRSATKLVIEQTCPAPHASTGKTTMLAKTPQSIVAVIDTVQGNASGKVHVDLKGRWLGASCEGIEE